MTQVLARGEALSPAELRILRATADGLTNREIAARHYLSPATVKNHQTHIRQKLGARNRAQVVLVAAQLGLLDGVVVSSDTQPLSAGQLRAFHAKANDLDRRASLQPGSSKQITLVEASGQFGRAIEHANHLRALEASWCLDRLADRIEEAVADRPSTGGTSGAETTSAGDSA